jgi:hypothetical protein
VAVAGACALNYEPLERILVDRDAAHFEKFAYLNDFFLREIVMGMRESGRMPAELYTDPVAGFVVDLCSKIFQQVDNLLEVDIRADGMGKQGVQRLAVMVIHLCSLIKVARIGWTENAQGAYQPSLI